VCGNNAQNLNFPMCSTFELQYRTSGTRIAMVKRMFESQLPGISTEQAAHTCASVTKQYNLVPTDGR